MHHQQYRLKVRPVSNTKTTLTNVVTFNQYYFFSSSDYQWCLQGQCLCDSECLIAYTCSVCFYITYKKHNLILSLKESYPLKEPVQIALFEHIHKRKHLLDYL